MIEEVDCGFSKEQKFVFMRGLFATSIGTLLEIANAHRDQLSPYMAEVLDQVGPVGPRQAEEAEVLLEQLHRQVQQRVFGNGYRILLMPTMATPLVRADMFKSKEDKVDVWTARYRLATVDFPIADIDPFFNTNRPEDLAEAERLLAGRRAG